MAKFGSDAVIIEFDNSSDVLQDMSQFILEFNGFDIEAILEESHSFGDSWVEQLFTGLKKVNQITLRGFYDDQATTGPNAIFNALGDTRTLKVTWGGGKTSQVETVIKNYRRLPTRGELHKFEVVLEPTAAVTEV